MLNSRAGRDLRSRARCSWSRRGSHRPAAVFSATGLRGAFAPSHRARR